MMRACIALGVSGFLACGAVAAAEPAGTPASGEATLSNRTTEVRLDVWDVAGTAEDLKGLTAERLTALGRQRRAEPRVLRFASVRAQADISNPLQLMSGVRVPVSIPVPHSQSFSVSYRNYGIEVNMGGVWKSGGDGLLADVQLKITATPVPLPGIPKPARQVLEKKLTVAAGTPTMIFLSELPAGESDGLAELKVATLTLQPDGESVSRPAKDSVLAQRSVGELSVLQLSASNATISALELPALTAGRPPRDELLKRLSGHGDAVELGAGTFTFDPATARTKMSFGERVPSVQDVVVSPSGVVTPSVTYEEVGTILEFAGSEWRETDGAWVIRHHFELEASGIGESGVAMPGKFSLPTFYHWKTEQDYVFRSGEPVYFTFRGPPTPSGKPDGKATLVVARLCLTRSTAGD
jgi:hypothetical protein